MEMRSGVGWQYALTDLSLILFMVAADSVSKMHVGAAVTKQAASAADARPPRPLTIQAPVVADPVAVWRAGEGMPSLASWLTSQARDPRQRLTIVAHYTGANAGPASTRAAELLAGAGKSAGQVRLLVEPGPEEDLSAALTWDAGETQANGGTK